jgi:hypothetical protein
MRFNRRLVGAINFSVVFLFCVSAHRISLSRQSLFIRLSRTGSDHQDYDQRRVDCFTEHGASPSEFANFIYILPVC